MPSEDGKLKTLLKELVDRAGGPKLAAEQLCERQLPITATAISNYTAGTRTPTNSMVAALLDIGCASPEEAAAVWVAAGVPAMDLRESAEGGAT